MSHLRLMDEQFSLMPFSSPDTVVNHLSQLVTRVTHLKRELAQPELGPERCNRLLGQVAMVATVLDAIQHEAEHLAAYYAKKSPERRRISLA